MKKAMKVTTLLTAVLLAAAPFTMAQDEPANKSGGQISVGVLGRKDVASSKFTEYREVPKGVSVPFFNLYSIGDKVDFKLFGYRGEEGGGVYSAVNSVVEIPGPLNEITQDISMRAAKNFKKGNMSSSRCPKASI